METAAFSASYARIASFSSPLAPSMCPPAALPPSPRAPSFRLRPISASANITSATGVATSACAATSARSQQHMNGSRRLTPADVTEAAALDDGATGHVSDADRRQQTVAAIAASGIVACVRADSADVALSAARAALAAGIEVLEVTCTTPGVFEVIASLVKEFPKATIGAGTVLTPHDAMAAQRAGARFLMSPATDPELVASHAKGPTVFIPGAMTPTEILSATRLGAPLVKLFPAPYAGGEALVRAMHRAAPSIGIVPAHGIQLGLIEGYLKAGATAVVLSEAIFEKEAIKRQDYERIAQRAAEAVAVRRNVLLSQTH
ncbi:hypothetical protein CLOM_g21361 [Closterium sp. NIES-68]|nr:hypothetical protein CLOM_g21361 [Closterium sp. NIES-68]GJP84606.1 hypothetical protein CLOP_g14661 [Closterium sp. NIES-67]